MPTADAYRRAASQLRGLGRRLTDGIHAVRIATDDIAEGPVATEIRRALDAARDDVGRAEVELDRLATVCERRAEICAEHVAELIRHRHLSASTEGWLSPPEPPAWWVDP